MHRFINVIARRRVASGFVSGAVALWFAQPSWTSLLAGGAVALAGEALRVWAAGHLDKGREVTMSGPYRWMRHPLYVGSALMGAGLGIAARSVGVAALVGAYLAVTLSAAIRTEEATLGAKFGDTYRAYREGRAAAAGRRFSVARAIANREHRTIGGLLLAMAVLALRMKMV